MIYKMKESTKVILAYSVFLVGLGLLSHPAAAGSQKGSSCPSGNQSALNRVQSFLAEPAWASARQELGISVSTDRARVLSDSQDPSACQTLSEKFPDPEGKNRLFYKAGPYYFVIYEREPQPDGDVTIGSPGFIVLDQNFEVLRFYI
jgi:hypothetical protein